MISNKGFPFLLFYKPCVSSLLWWGEAGRLSNYLPHYSCPGKWYKVFPLIWQIFEGSIEITDRRNLFVLQGVQRMKS